VTQCGCPSGGETQEIYDPRAAITTHRAAVARCIVLFHVRPGSNRAAAGFIEWW